MPNSIIAEGKTTNEAIENGLKQLHVSKHQVEIKVLESEEKRSFFSILAPRVVKVELTLKEESKNVENKVKKELKEITQNELDVDENNIKIFLDEFSKSLNTEMTYEITKSEYGINVNINGENTGFLIGYRGETLYAMQNVISSVASRGLKDRIRVILDIEGYKAKREKTLEDLADKIAKTVVKTRRDVTLEPMQPYERKIIHSRLQNNDKVSTRSIGEEPKRRVVISLNK